MKKFSYFISILIILGIIYWSFSDLKPGISSQKNLLQKDFSLDKALVHVKNISQKEHYVGSVGHKEVQKYLVDELKNWVLKLKLNKK